MPFTYHDGSRRLQDDFDTRRLADRLDERFLQHPAIEAGDKEFIEQQGTETGAWRGEIRGGHVQSSEKS